jgi:hypothetical protein
MQLREAIRDIDSLHGDSTLFAERIDGAFSPQSPTVAHELTEAESSQPIREVAKRVAPGCEYFLELCLVQELLAGWRENHAGQSATLDEALECVIFYAENDAYPEAFFGS